MFLRGFKSYFRLFLRALLSLILILVSQTFRTVSPGMLLSIVFYFVLAKKNVVIEKSTTTFVIIVN